MGGPSTITPLGTGPTAANAERYARLRALVQGTTPPPPKVETSSSTHQTDTYHRGPQLQAEGHARTLAQRVTVTGPHSRMGADQLQVDAAGRFQAQVAGASSSGAAQGLAFAQGEGVAHVEARSSYVKAPGLMAAQARALAMAAGRLRAAAAGHLEAGKVALNGVAALEAEGIAQAVAEGSAVIQPTLLAAQGRLLAEAAARLRTAVGGQAQLGDSLKVSAAASAEAEAVARAQAMGQVVVSPTQFTAMGKTEAMAIARTRMAAEGRVDVNNQMLAEAGLAAETVAGGETRTEGLVHVGVDRFGLPSFGIGAKAEASAGAAAKTQAKGGLNILGLIRIGASGSVEALAGAAAGLSGKLDYSDGAITLGLGGKAAAGVGAGAGATVTVGLGKLPGGVLQVVGSPILPLPGLLGTSIVRGVRALSGAEGPDPTAGQPGIEDFPRVVADNFTNGVKLIGAGAGEVVDQVVGIGKAIGDGAVAVGGAVVDGTVYVAKGVGSFFAGIGKGIAG
ncbi:MAG TPA: hypothetical protein V6D05_04820, partial [Stenomitos sp.]